MSLSTVTKVLVTNKINGPLDKNVVLHLQFIIILPLYALNNKNTPVASSAEHVISAWQSKCFNNLHAPSSRVWTCTFESPCISIIKTHKAKPRYKDVKQRNLSLYTWNESAKHHNSPRNTLTQFSGVIAIIRENGEHVISCSDLASKRNEACVEVAHLFGRINAKSDTYRFNVRLGQVFVQFSKMDEGESDANHIDGDPEDV